MNEPVTYKQKTLKFLTEGSYAHQDCIYLIKKELLYLKITIFYFNIF